VTNRGIRKPSAFRAADAKTGGMHGARVMARRRDVNDTELAAELADFAGAVAAFPRKVLTADLNRHCGASLRN